MNAEFIQVYDKYLALKKPNIQEGSYKSLEKLKAKIEKYEQVKRKKLFLSEVSFNWFENFVKGMVNGKYGKCTNGTIKLQVGIICGFLANCKIFGYVVNEDYVKFREFAKSYKIPKFDRPVLLDEELATLWKHKGHNLKNKKFAPLTAYNEKVKDLFVFQTQVGFRWGDIGRLTRGDIIISGGKYYVNNFTTQKRKANISVQLNDLAMLIVHKHSKRFERLSAKTPIFKKVPDVANANHKLKLVAEKAKIDRVVEVQKGKLSKVKKIKLPFHKVLTTHMARSKFATDWIVADKDIYKLKIILGHKSIKTTENYIRTLPNWLPAGIETELDLEKMALFDL